MDLTNKFTCNKQNIRNHHGLQKPEAADFERRMQRAAMSCFAPSIARECTIVLDRASAETRQEIARDAPPPLRFLTTNGTEIITSVRLN